jgi:hypothetical protein
MKKECLMTGADAQQPSLDPRCGCWCAAHARRWAPQSYMGNVRYFYECDASRAGLFLSMILKP